MLFFSIVLFLLFKLICGLQIKFDERIIFDQHINTLELVAGILFLAENERHEDLIKLLDIKWMDMTIPHVEAFSKFKHKSVEIVRNLLEMYKSGFLPEEEAKKLLPTQIINEVFDADDFSEEEIFLLPMNPLSDENFDASKLEENVLIAAMKRAFLERDQQMCWKTWPYNMSVAFRTFWSDPIVLHVLAIEAFCYASIYTKGSMIKALQARVESIVIPSEQAVNDLLISNLALFAFYMEIYKMKKTHLSKSSERINTLNQTNELEKNCLKVFTVISHKKQIKNGNEDLFEMIDFESAKTAAELETDVVNNRFYYEKRVKAFFLILQRIQSIEFAFADWLSNLFIAFRDVFPKMSFELINHAWDTLLSLKPTIGTLQTFFNYFYDTIEEGNILILARKVPKDILLAYFNKLNMGYLPKLTELIPFKLRLQKYLFSARKGTAEIYSYGLCRYYESNIPFIARIFKVFEDLRSDNIDIFETIDLSFEILKPSGMKSTISLKKFLEIILQDILKMHEWFIPIASNVTKTGLKTSEKLTVIPSPLFPPQYAESFAKIVIRCAQIMCDPPFFIAEKYLIFAFKGGSEAFRSESLKKFIKMQSEYMNSDENLLLPRYSKAYNVYFSQINQILNTDSAQKYNLEQNLALSRVIKSLWIGADNRNNFVFSIDDLNSMSTSMNEIFVRTLNGFSGEFVKKVPVRLFCSDEIYKVMYR